MTPDQIRALAHIPLATAEEFAGPLNAAAARFGIETTADRAHFVAQAVHESLGFTRLVENLNYKVQALLDIWPKRFTRETANLYGRVDGVKAAHQQMIANTAYANRMGNGSVESGDGWRYRGRGIGGLTGKDNYHRFGIAVGMDLVSFPEQVALPPLACASFAWFWKTHGLSELANANQTDRISVIVNGGDLGLQVRRDLTETAMEILA